MKLFLNLTQDDIQKEIPYGVICEARYGSRWETGKRRRAWKEAFSEAERAKCSRLFSLSRKFYLVSGAPESMSLSPQTMDLWQRLGNFCAAI